LSGRDGELIECSTIEAVFSGVHNGTFDEGVVPVENSTEGAVGVVLDLMASRFDLAVRGEVILPVHQCLMARPGVRLEKVERVISHPQALAQCREFLGRHLPGAAQEESPSTAAAASRVAASSRPWAALGCARSAVEYGLEVLVPVANDCPGNVTRFWIIGREQLACQVGPGCKTSIIFGVHDRPGALYAILREFALRGINLTRIESRPAKKRLGDYLFFIDFTGCQDDPEVRKTLERVAAKTVNLKILGSYPLVDHTAHSAESYLEL